MNDQYDFDLNDLNLLKALVILPVEERARLLTERYSGTAPAPAWVIDLLANFIGMANSIIQNSHEMLKLSGIVDGQMHPNEADRINFPSLMGALDGVELAHGVPCDRLCNGCAFRKGTPANQSPVTTDDAAYCLDDSEPDFMCHMHMMNGEPTRKCMGYIEKRKNQKQLPIPARNG